MPDHDRMAVRIRIAEGFRVADREPDLLRRQKILQEIYGLLQQVSGDAAGIASGACRSGSGGDAALRDAQQENGERRLSGDSPNTGQRLLARLDAGEFTLLDAADFLRVLALCQQEAGGDTARLAPAVSAWLEARWLSPGRRGTFVSHLRRI